MGWEADLEEARRRVSALDPQRELARALEAAASVRGVTPFSGFFAPLPHVVQSGVSLFGAFWDGEDSDHVHLDGRGRPVAHVSRYETLALWEWDEDGSFLEISVRGQTVRRFRTDHVVTASADGWMSLERLTWRDGCAVRSDRATLTPHGVHPLALEAAYDADGRLERVRRAWDDPAPGDLRSGLERAALLAPDRVDWDGRVSSPEPWPADAEALVEPLASALDAALRGAVADAPVAAPFVLQVFAAEDVFPPRARVVGDAWRAGLRSEAGLLDLHDAVQAGYGVELDLVDRLDPDALRACRALNTAFHPSARRTRDPGADTLADAAGDRLAELLHAAPLPGAADPFLALVEFSGRASGTRGRERARRTAPQYERFMAVKRSPSPRVPVEEALRDRAALERYLAAGGLPDHARRLAHDVAEVGFLLTAGGGRSRLGGRALLPPGEPWPVSAAGAAMTFLSGIDLGELPPSPLPDRGWLLFFADLESFIEDEDEACVLFTDSPVEAVPAPGDLVERRVVAVPHLTLPSGWDSHEIAGLGVVEGKVYGSLAYALVEASLNDGPHWIGGWATGAQGALGDSDTWLLLSMAFDEALGFAFLDGGVLQFRIPPDALAERDWSRVVAVADSC